MLKSLQEIQWRTTNVESNDKILNLKPMEGKKATNSRGDVDPRLLKGENHLHAVQDGTLWKFKFESGEIPVALRQRWTTFSRALTAAKEYYGKHNVEITEVIK